MDAESNLLLENERKRQEEATNVILKDILQKTNVIHASFLFWNLGAKLLQQLIHCLCSTPEYRRHKNWVDLAHEIGLNQLVVLSIQNTPISKQDPVYSLLQAFMQKEEATIAKIYAGLSEIKRFDVITRSYEDVIDFYKNICKLFKLPENGKILTPPQIPEVPFIYKNLDKTIETENKETRSVTNYNTKQIKCDKIVMLTYTSADANLAAEIARELREIRVDGKRIGVIMLNEHVRDIQTNREGLVIRFYTRSDYIIPIISINYLNMILNYKTSDENSLQNMDSYYAKFIYDVMNNEYIIRGCRNVNVRCVIPQTEFHQVLQNIAYQPLFNNTWVISNKISELGNNILKTLI